jgi:hypothetical protein
MFQQAMRCRLVAHHAATPSRSNARLVPALHHQTVPDVNRERCKSGRNGELPLKEKVAAQTSACRDMPSDGTFEFEPFDRTR